MKSAPSLLPRLPEMLNDALSVDQSILEKPKVEKLRTSKELSVPMSWNPIETAPKDGTHLLLQEVAYGKTHLRIGWWKSYSKGSMFLSDNDGVWVGCISTPKYWMKLPCPKEEEDDAL